MSTSALCDLRNVNTTLVKAARSTANNDQHTIMPKKPSANANTTRKALKTQLKTLIIILLTWQNLNQHALMKQ